MIDESPLYRMILERWDDAAPYGQANWWEFHLCQPDVGEHAPFLAEFTAQHPDLHVRPEETDPQEYRQFVVEQYVEWLAREGIGQDGWNGQQYPQYGQYQQGADQGAYGQQYPQYGQYQQGADQGAYGQQYPQYGQYQQGADRGAYGQQYPQYGQYQQGADQGPYGQQQYPQYDQGGQQYPQYDQSGQQYPQYDQYQQGADQGPYGQQQYPQYDQGGQQYPQYDQYQQGADQGAYGQQQYPQYDQGGQQYPQYDQYQQDEGDFPSVQEGADGGGGGHDTQQDAPDVGEAPQEGDDVQGAPAPSDGPPAAEEDSPPTDPAAIKELTVALAAFTGQTEAGATVTEAQVQLMQSYGLTLEVDVDELPRQEAATTA